MAEEVELKFCLAAADARRLARAPLVRQAVSRRRQLLVSVYYDTPDLRLREAGIALRLRRIGGRWVRTVKCAGQVVAGLARRPEWERPHGRHFDFSDIDDEAARTQLTAAVAAGSLQPIFTTRFWRTSWLVEPSPDERIEIALDRGEISAAQRHEEICEIEIERLAGDETTLFDCARRLVECAALFPETESKADRGYRLFANEPRRPVKGKRLHLSSDMPAAAAASAILFSCFEQLLANRAGAVVGDDPEYIHQLRVAARRFRVALRFFAPLLPAEDGDFLAVTMKEVMAHLADSRELDVFAEWLAERRAASNESLIAHVERKREKARAQARAYLASRRFARELIEAMAHLDAFSRRADRPSPAASPVAEEGAATPTPFAAFARRRLKNLCDTLKERAAKAGRGKPRRLHDLRIAIKRLRYAIEYCLPAGSGNARWSAVLAKWQERLGRINDLCQFEAKIIDMAREERSLAAAAEILLAPLRQETKQLIARAIAGGFKELRTLKATQLIVAS